MLRCALFRQAEGLLVSAMQCLPTLRCLQHLCQTVASVPDVTKRLLPTLRLLDLPSDPAVPSAAHWRRVLFD